MDDTTVTEILLTEGFSFSCSPLSVLLLDIEGQNWIEDCSKLMIKVTFKKFTVVYSFF